VLEGPTMVIAPHIISSRGGHGDESIGLSSGRSVELGALADGADEMLTRVREEVRAHGDWIKFAASGGFTSPGDSPEDTTYTQEEMNALVAAASDYNRPCAAHAFGDEAVHRAVTAGVRSVEHALLASPKTLSDIARKGVFVVPTAYAAMRYMANLDNDDFWRDLPPEVRTKVETYAEPMRQTLRQMARSELRVAFGSDAGMFAHEDSCREFVALVDNGFSPERVLRAATSEAADLLRLDDRGSIRPGQRADLVAVPGNPVRDIGVMERVDFVMKAGRLVRSPFGS
jgi:imidazolonepropionase-like amidohydrolase